MERKENERQKQTVWNGKGNKDATAYSHPDFIAASPGHLWFTEK